MDDEFFSEEKPVPLTGTQGIQLSLSELFFITTLAAVAFGIYIYISPLVALLGAGCLIVAAVVRLLGRRHFLIGGIVGFFAAMAASVLIAASGTAEPSIAMLILLIGPCVGYVAGVVITEFSENELF